MLSDRACSLNKTPLQQCREDIDTCTKTSLPCTRAVPLREQISEMLHAEYMTKDLSEVVRVPNAAPGTVQLQHKHAPMRSERR